MRVLVPAHCLVTKSLAILVFNILFVLGVAAAIHPMVFQMENIIDIIVLVVMSIIVLCFAWTKRKLVRWEGFTMFVMYAAYVVYCCLR